jgi:hypothetical protein
VQVRHSGKLGDIVYSLAAVQAHPGTIYYVNADGSRLNRAAGESVLDLLTSHPYIRGASVWSGEWFDVDLDRLMALVRPRVGYANLHLYVNALALKAFGDWLLFWNDDALMATQGWDEIVAGYTGQFVVLNPETNHGNQSKNQCIFPILPKGYVRVLGHVSVSNHYDTYVEPTVKQIGIRRDVPIVVTNDRPDLTGSETDSTYAEQTIQTDDFFGPENCKRIGAYASLPASYLTQRPLDYQDTARS